MPAVMKAHSPSIAEQKKFYDSFLSKKNPVNHLQTARCGAILMELSRLQLWTPRILDFGCGDGWLTAVLSTFGETTGADLSPEVAAERFSGIRFVAADFNTWQPDLEPFDVVVSQEVIEHLEDQAHYLEIAASLLKPGGYLILTTPNARITRAWRGHFDRQPIENVLTAQELRALLRRQFEMISLRTILPGYGNLGPGNAWAGLHHLLNSGKARALLLGLDLLRAYTRALEFSGLGLHFVAVAKKA